MGYLLYVSLFFIVSVPIALAVGSHQATLKRRVLVHGAHFWLASPFLAYAAVLAHREQQDIVAWMCAGMTVFLLLQPVWLYFQARRMSRFVEQVAASMRQSRRGRNIGAA